MSRSLTLPLLLTALISAQVTFGQQTRKFSSKAIRVAPSTAENPKADAKLLRRGTSVVVHAIITKTGHVTNIEFVKGNAELMSEVRRTLKNWKYKPFIYQGQLESAKPRPAKHLFATDPWRSSGSRLSFDVLPSD
jgi:outer membrane biosynthesis protein TonB